MTAGGRGAVPSRPSAARLPGAAGLVGREAELGQLLAGLVPGGAALLLGGKGVGKSALLEAARDAAIAAGFDAGLAHSTEQAAVSLARLLAALGAGSTPGQAVGVLQARLVQRCSDRPAALFVDDADRAGPGLLRALRRVVLETRACVFAAARTGPADPPSRLRRALFPGSREVRLGPLPPGPARSLARRWLGAAGGLAVDIARESGGVPAAIVEMARRHRDARYRFGGRVSWALLLADLRIENRI